MDRKQVLICDDQDPFIEQFKANHGDFYDIVVVRDIRNILDKLQGMSQLPDLVLLDLYHPFSEGEGFKERSQRAELELDKLRKQIDCTKQAVDAAWCPLGVEILKDIRKKYDARRLPVVIYSQCGLFLLDSEKTRSIEEQNGHWLVKNQSNPRTEKTRIDRIIKDAEYAKPILNSYRFALALSWAFIVGFVVVSYLPAAFIWKTIGGLISSVLSGIFTHFITRSYENFRH